MFFKVNFTKYVFQQKESFLMYWKLIGNNDQKWEWLHFLEEIPKYYEILGMIPAMVAVLSVLCLWICTKLPIFIAKWAVKSKY